MKTMMIILSAWLLPAVCMAEIPTISKGFKPSYEVQEAKRVDFGKAKRLVLRVTVNHGLSKNDVEANMRHAVAAYGLDMHATSIAVYETGDSCHSSFSVGQCNFAPGGDWAKAIDGLKDPEKKTYNFKFQFIESYFKPAAAVNQDYFGLTRIQRNQLIAEMEEASHKIGLEGTAEMAKTGDYSKAAFERQMKIEEARHAKAYTKIAASCGLTKEQAEELWSNKLTEQFGD